MPGSLYVRADGCTASGLGGYVSSSVSGLLGDQAHVPKARSRRLSCCPGVAVVALGRPPHRARDGHDLLFRRFLCRHSDPFRTVRNLGLVSPGCTGGSGSSKGCSSAWLPAWLPDARPEGTTNGFQEHAWFTTRHRCYLPCRRSWMVRQARSSRVYPAISRLGGRT